MTKSNKFVIGLLTGTIAGAVAGLLLSPNSGKANREIAAARASEFRQRAGETVGELRQRAGETVGEFRQRAGETVGNLRQRVGQRGQGSEENEDSIGRHL